MAELKIRTNNVPRLVLDWDQLTDAEKKNFDYLKTRDEKISASFVRYKGWAYDLGEFLRWESPEPKEMHKWDGYSSDSYFSGVLMRYAREPWGKDGSIVDSDHVVMATYFS